MAQGLAAPGAGPLPATGLASIDVNWVFAPSIAFSAVAWAAMQRWVAQPRRAARPERG